MCELIFELMQRDLARGGGQVTPTHLRAQNANSCGLAGAARMRARAGSYATCARVDFKLSCKLASTWLDKVPRRIVNIQQEFVE